MESLTDVTRLAESWQVHLDAANLSPNTIKLYLSAVQDLRSFLDSTGIPTDVADLTREHIEAYLVHLRERTSARRESLPMSWAEFPIFESKITRRRPDADRRSSAAGLAALVGLRASSGRTRAAS